MHTGELPSMWAGQDSYFWPQPQPQQHQHPATSNDSITCAVEQSAWGGLRSNTHDDTDMDMDDSILPRAQSTGRFSRMSL